MCQSVDILYYMFGKNESSLTDELFVRHYEKSPIKNIGHLIIHNKEDINETERDVIIHFRSVIESVDDGAIVYE